MNKNIIWAIIGVVVLAGLVYFMMGNDSSEDVSETEDNTAQENQDTTTAGTFRDLLASGVSQRCTFSDTESGSDGTVYVSGGRMRGDFSTEVNNTATMGHMIVKDNTFYMWAEGQSQGFQMSLDAEAQADALPTDFADLDKEVDYDCDSTAVSDGQFELPAGVTFTNISSLGL